MTRFALASLLVFAVTMTAVPSRAEGADPTAAAAAYDEGLEAYKRGELRKAAASFARADAIVPSPIALQAALDAAIEADDALLGEELLERSKREPPAPTLASSITTAHLKFNGRAGRVRLVCPRDSTCTAKVDDTTMELDKVMWVAAGPRAAIVHVDGTPHTKTIDVPSGQVIEITPSAKGSPGPPTLTARPVSIERTPSDSAPPRRTSGVLFGSRAGAPRIVFYAGVGLTALLAVSTAYFAVDTANRHGAFKNAGCVQANFSDCEDLKTKGENSQTAANVFAVLTGLSAAATAIVGIAFTDWNGPVVAVYPGGGGAQWNAAF